MRLNVLAISLSMAVAIAISGGKAFGQGTMHRPVPQSSTTDSSGNLKTGENPASKSGPMVHGTVSFADGTAPDELVEINAACPNGRRLLAIADSKGKFSSGIDLAKDCTVYASLEGYRSDAVQVAGHNLGNIVLRSISSDQAGLTSQADGTANSSQRKAYEKALDKAAKADWKGASIALREVVAADPSYASALLTLGVCEQNLGNPAEAEKAYLESARADPNFALPLVRAAAIESAKGNMPAALIQSEKAIALNPKAFPDAYSVNAIANISTQHADAAEASARAGLALDNNHQYPELEYALGMVLSTKDNTMEAREHLQKYVDQSPDGPNAAAAKNQLTQMQKSETSAAGVVSSATAQQAGPAVAVKSVELLPATALLQERNAPLLAHSEAYTCLESILPAKVDQHGKPSLLDTIRVDIAVSGGKEIYGAADGKHFSNTAQRELLGYSFSTTGLFGSIARALIAANQFVIEPAGESSFKGQPALRYNFRSLPTTAGWTIAYGKESGTAMEHGWFLIDGKTQILRRVFVAAANLPANLKLADLSALIDYEPETIAERRVLLPSAARMQVVERSGLKHVSLLSFDHCRAFTADSSVSFDEPDSESQINKVINPARLPLNAEMLISLISAVSVETAAGNDVITASVVKPVMANGREVIQAGALLEGHVRLKQGENAVVIQFDRVQTASGWLPFYAQLIKVGSSAAQIQSPGGPDQTMQTLLATDIGADLTEPGIPGAATLTFPAKDAALTSGTQMVWRTQPLLVEHKDALVPQLNTSMSMH